MMNIKSFLVKHSPEILTGCAITGVIFTSVLSAQSAVKAHVVLREEDMLYDSFESRAKKTWQCFLPPISSAALTIATIITLRNVQAGRIAAGWAAASITQRQLRDYRDVVKKRLGRAQESSIRDEVAERKVESLGSGSPVVIADGKVLCLDLLSGRTFEAEPDAVKKVENAINYDLVHGDAVSLNDFYDRIGLDHISIGDNLGWSTFDKVEIILSSHLMADNTPVLAIGFENDPRPDFYHNH